MFLPAPIQQKQFVRHAHQAADELCLLKSKLQITNFIFKGIHI